MAADPSQHRASMSAHIVNVPQPQCAYNASKAGVTQLTKSLAIEWAKTAYVLTVSVLDIGTELTLNSPTLIPLIEKMEQNEMAPMGRMGKPEELEAICVYLAETQAHLQQDSILWLMEHLPASKPECLSGYMEMHREVYSCRLIFIINEKIRCLRRKGIYLCAKELIIEGKTALGIELGSNKNQRSADWIIRAMYSAVAIQYDWENPL